MDTKLTPARGASIPGGNPLPQGAAEPAAAYGRVLAGDLQASGAGAGQGPVPSWAGAHVPTRRVRATPGKGASWLRAGGGAAAGQAPGVAEGRWLPLRAGQDQPGPEHVARLQSGGDRAEAAGRERRGPGCRKGGRRGSHGRSSKSPHTRAALSGTRLFSDGSGSPNGSHWGRTKAPVGRGLPRRPQGRTHSWPFSFWTLRRSLARGPFLPELRPPPPRAPPLSDRLSCLPASLPRGTECAGHAGGEAGWQTWPAGQTTWAPGDSGWGGECHRGDLTGQRWSSRGSTGASGLEGCGGDCPGGPGHGAQSPARPPAAPGVQPHQGQTGGNLCRERRPLARQLPQNLEAAGLVGAGGEQASGGRTAPSARGLGGPPRPRPRSPVVPRPGMPGPRGIRALVCRAHSGRVSGRGRAAGRPPPRPPPRRARGGQGGLPSLRPCPRLSSRRTARAFAWCPQ